MSRATKQVVSHCRSADLKYVHCSSWLPVATPSPADAARTGCESVTWVGWRAARHHGFSLPSSGADPERSSSSRRSRSISAAISPARRSAAARCSASSCARRASCAARRSARAARRASRSARCSASRCSATASRAGRDDLSRRVYHPHEEHPPPARRSQCQTPGSRGSPARPAPPARPVPLPTAPAAVPSGTGRSRHTSGTRSSLA